MCNYAKQLTALGTTIVVASGDNGVNGGHPGQETCPPFKPTYPSGCQYVLSVGATVGFPERSVSYVDDLFWGVSANQECLWVMMDTDLTRTLCREVDSAHSSRYRRGNLQQPAPS